MHRQIACQLRQMIEQAREMDEPLLAYILAMAEMEVIRAELIRETAIQPIARIRRKR